MNVTLIQNHYQQPGGEDKVFAAEATVLESHGHTVTRYTVHNDAIDDIGQLHWRNRLCGTAMSIARCELCSGKRNPTWSTFAQYTPAYLARRLLRGQGRRCCGRTSSAQLPDDMPFRLLLRRPTVRALRG